MQILYSLLIPLAVVGGAVAIFAFVVNAQFERDFKKAVAERNSADKKN